MLLLSVDFFKINFFKKLKSFRVSNGFDLDQVGNFVGPDLGSNCLQRLSANNKSCRWHL